MGLLTRTQIDKAADLETADVDCPEWGGAVRLRALDGVGRAAWMAAASEEDRAKRLDNVLARLVSLCAVDDKGDLLFPGPEGAAALGKRSGRVLDRLFDAAQKLSKLRPADVADAEKNSEGTGSDASCSASAFPSATPTPTTCLGN